MLLVRKGTVVTKSLRLQALRDNAEVLKVMHEYLNQEEPDLQRVLFEVWNAQRESLKYGELTNVLMGGDISQQTLNEWRNDYAVMVNEKIAPKWRDAMEAAASHIEIDRFVFDPAARAITDWMTNRTSELAVNLTESQHEAIRFVSRRMYLLGEITGKQLSADELSRFLRPMIGMVPREAEAVRRFFQEQIENGIPVEDAQRQALNYANRIHRHRAMRIARTELAFAYNHGADQSVRQAQEQGLIGRVRKQFLTADDERVCSYCGPLDGKIIEMNESFFGATKKLPYVPTPPLHPHCLLPGTKVIAPNLVGGVKRWFEGRIITLRTADGDELSVTPNHPVLTRRGWVAAGEIQEGDQLVKSTDAQRLARAFEPDYQHVPTAVEQIPGSFFEDGSMLRRSVPIAAEDFHGDGIDGDVGIVWSYRKLAGNFKSRLGKLLSDVIFSMRSGVPFRLPLLGFGSVDFMPLAGSASSTCFMCGRSKFDSLTGGHLGQSDFGRFTGVSRFDAMSREDSAYGSSGHLEVFGELKDGISSAVSLDDVIGYVGVPRQKRDSVSLTDRSDVGSGSLKPSVNGGRDGIELLCNLLDRHSALVKFADVVEVRRWEGSTHVYNLQTKQGWYLAENIITHNCRCTVIYLEE
nr:phage minor head protein [Cohnella massiliensis]